MKKLFKLIFLAILAGVTYKYLTDKDINIPEILSDAREWGISLVEELERAEGYPESSSVEENNGDVTGSGLPDLNFRMENEAPASGRIASSPDTPEAPDVSQAVEYHVAEKMSWDNSSFASLDNYARAAPPEAESSMDALAAWLKRHADGEKELVRLIFTWIATHVYYDDDGFNTGNYADTSPESVFRNRISVCHGYSTLFTALCQSAGIEAVTIIGYAKGIGYRPGSGFSDTNHAWNAAMIDGEWKLFDVTWASGYGKGVNGKLVTVHEFNDYWFNVNPNEAIFTHLPEDEAWQLNNPKITKYQFERLPNVSSQYFRLGFNGDRCLPAILAGSLESLPEAYSVSGDIKVKSMPYSGRIVSGQTIRLRVTAGEGITPAYENGGRISEMTRDGNEYTAVVTTIPGRFRLMMTYGGGSYETVLVYSVR
jgi:hypothetical protein